MYLVSLAEDGTNSRTVVDPICKIDYLQSFGSDLKVPTQAPCRGRIELHSCAANRIKHESRPSNAQAFDMGSIKIWAR